MLTWSELLQLRTQRLLYIVVIVMSAIFMRLIFLAVYKHDEFIIKAQKPHERVELISAARGCIFDRLGVPLATNRLGYEVGVCYQDFNLFPSSQIMWQEGKRVRTYPKREQVKKLAKLLAEEINISLTKVEDFIYSQAALNPSQTIILKKNLDEQTFYRLKAKELFFSGLRAQTTLSRYYPYGPLGGQILGYVGQVNPDELKKLYESIAGLQAQLAIEEDEASMSILNQKISEMRLRIKNSQEIVGKAGLEKFYENILRGQDGQRSSRSFNRVLSEQKTKEIQAAKNGRSIKLAIDSRLQLFAEQLLADNEQIRDSQLANLSPPWPQQWVKGGSIVVMDPHSGEVLALASYPRFDPELFLQTANQNLNRQAPWNDRHFWLEDKFFISCLWNGQYDLVRQIYDREQDHFLWQHKKMTWEHYLESICGPKSLIHTKFSKLNDLKSVLGVAQSFSIIKAHLGEEIKGWNLINFLYNSAYDIPYWTDNGTKQDIQLTKDRWQQVTPVLALEKERRILDQAVSDLPSNFDKMLFIELCALLIDEDSFASIIPEELEKISLEAYRSHTSSYLFLRNKIKKLASQWHEEIEFNLWRQNHQRSYLKEKRSEEKRLGIQAKPYIHHLEAKREALFQEFWQECNEEIIQTFIIQSACEPKLATAIEFIQQKLLKDPEQSLMCEATINIKNAWHVVTEKLFSRYLKSMKTYDQLNKSLWGQYPLIKKLNPKRSDLAAFIYPRYGLGYMNHKAVSHLSAPGSVFKLVLAYEALHQRHAKGLGKSWETMSPFKIIDTNYRKGSQQIISTWSSGKEISQIYRGGRIPKSQRRHIGEIDLLGAIESSSNPYFSLLADLELADGPQNLLTAAYQLGWGACTGIDLPFERAGILPYDLSSNRTGLYTSAIGQHTLLGTPMQASVMLSAFANGGKILRPKLVQDDLEPEVKSLFIFPNSIRDFLFEGMRRVVSGAKGTARVSAIKSFGNGTSEREIIQRTAPYMIGKTSTAEFNEVFGINLAHQKTKRSHIWFAGIIFDKPLSADKNSEKVTFHDKKAELVITICLHHGIFGKEAFPLAALLANRWREIKDK
jgi:cell division protein FtsI/penicillin-binding protein 2